MKAKDLRNSILQLAVQGKLVPQDPNDEPASALLERIRAERARLIKEKKLKAPKGGASVIYRASDGRHYEKRGKGEPVCIDDEIPFEIPESWEWVRLEELLQDIIVPIRDKPAKLDGPIPWCRIEDVEGRYISRSLSGQGVDKNTIVKMNLKVYPAGTVLCSNSATIGVPAIVTAPLVTNQRFIGFQPAEGLSSTYLYLLFLAFSSTLATVGTGTTHAYISRTKFEQLLVPLAPSNEQARIIAAIDNIIPIIDQYGTLESTRERLDAGLPGRLRKSILQMAVQGKLVEQNPADEPASVLLERIRDERARLIKAGKIKASKGGESVIYRASDGGYYEKRGKGEPVCIDDEIPFEIPESWAWVRLGSIAFFTGGGTPDKSNASFWNGDIPWASMKDIHGDYLNGTIDMVTQAGLASKPSITICKPGQIIVSTRLIPGKTIVSTIDCAINQDLKVVHTQLPASYLRVWFESHLDAFKKLGMGTTVPGIKLSDLEFALIPIPPLSEQQRIADSYELVSKRFTNQ